LIFLGKLQDFFFDEERWVIRYVEADQGKIFPNKKVLIPRALLDAPDWENKKFNVSLTRDDFDKCPSTEENKPVSQAYETRLLSHLQMQNYWAVAPPAPTGMTFPMRPIAPPETQIKEEDIDTKLRSFNEILGYTVNTTDGNHHRLSDIIVDDEDWQILYMVISDENNEHEVMFPINYVSEISYKAQSLNLNILSKDLKKAPEYNPASPVNTEYEKKVYDYYGRITDKSKTN
jgi:hypothetical protein